MWKDFWIWAKGSFCQGLLGYKQKRTKVKKFNLPSDYPLPNIFYFSAGVLKTLDSRVNKIRLFLKHEGFEECHLPFLVPKSVLLLYGNLISLNDFIKVYSGKDQRSYAYLRPHGIFSQGITLAKSMIRSYRNLPLRLYEVSPGYLAAKNTGNKSDVFSSPEQSFSVQAAVFTEDPEGYKYCCRLVSSILNNLALNYFVKHAELSKGKLVKYFCLHQGQEVEVARVHGFGEAVSQNANIYFSNKLGNQIFPCLCTFALSQNIFFLQKEQN